MDNKELSKKIMSFITSGAILVSSSLTLSCIKLVDDATNQKPYEYVLRDYKNFNVDTDVVDIHSNDWNQEKNIRLRMKEDRPVIVEYEDNMEDKEKEMIENVIAYYNDVFSTINENYKFVIRNKDTKIYMDDTVVSISNIENVTFDGYAKSNITIPDSGDGAFVLKAKIGLVWEKISEMNDDYARYVIMHEFAHLLGLGDVYYDGEHKNCDFIDMSTSMHLMNEFNKCLYPNDYAILQSLYSNEYLKHDNYEDAVKVVNNKIEKYTEYFYQQYSNYLKEKRNIFTDLKETDVPRKLSWKGQSKNNSNLLYEIDFINNKECMFIIKDSDGNLLEKCKGKTIFANGVLYIRDLYISEATNFSRVYQDGVGMKLLLCVYLNSNNQLVVKDGAFLMMNTEYVREGPTNRK